MNDQIDSSIPVLTEIIHPPGAALDEPKKSPIPTTAVPTKNADTTAPLSFAPQALIRENTPTIDLTDSTNTVSSEARSPELGSDEWVLLEQTIRENVLKQVLSRIDFVLEHRVSDSLAEVLQNAVDQLADDIRAGLKRSIEEVVTRAVNQELTKLRGTR